MSTSTTYAEDFYAGRHSNTQAAARIVLKEVLGILPPVRSAVDFGCGVGTWLSVLHEMGVPEILGIEGPWVTRSLLQIPEQHLRTVDFEGDIVLDRRFDLAITLEVAEHVSPGRASRFVDHLCKAADFVLFSAAIPGQGGTNHLNEQWPAYWAALFAERGYVPFDVLRRRLWNDARIPYWYRQNILLFATRERTSELRLPPPVADSAEAPMAIVHPGQLQATIDSLTTVRGASGALRSAVVRAFSRRLGFDRSTR